MSLRRNRFDHAPGSSSKLPPRIQQCNFFEQPDDFCVIVSSEYVYHHISFFLAPPQKKRERSKSMKEKTLRSSLTPKKWLGFETSCSNPTVMLYSQKSEGPIRLRVCAFP